MLVTCLLSGWLAGWLTAISNPEESFTLSFILFHSPPLSSLISFLFFYYHYFSCFPSYSYSLPPSASFSISIFPFFHFSISPNHLSLFPFPFLSVALLSDSDLQITTLQANSFQFNSPAQPLHQDIDCDTTPGTSLSRCTHLTTRGTAPHHPLHRSSPLSSSITAISDQIRFGSDRLRSDSDLRLYPHPYFQFQRIFIFSPGSSLQVKVSRVL